MKTSNHVCSDCKANWEASCDSTADFLAQYDPAEIPAAFYMTGHNGRSPFRLYLCDDHVEVNMDDATGVNVRAI